MKSRLCVTTAGDPSTPPYMGEQKQLVFPLLRPHGLCEKPTRFCHRMSVVGTCGLRQIPEIPVRSAALARHLLSPSPLTPPEEQLATTPPDPSSTDQETSRTPQPAKDPAEDKECPTEAAEPEDLRRAPPQNCKTPEVSKSSEETFDSPPLPAVSKTLRSGHQSPHDVRSPWLILLKSG